MHKVKLQIQLSGLQLDTKPMVSFHLNNECMGTAELGPQSRLFEFQWTLPTGEHQFGLNFQNKQYQNYPAGQDMAVFVESLTFQHLPDDFRYFGHYVPDYPEPWATEQRATGVELKSAIYGDYLGWNGTWYINFQTPIYRWIHQTQNLGWLI